MQKNTYERRNGFIGTETQLNILKRYYDMLFPSKFREDEYIRLIALRRNTEGQVVNSVVDYVQSFEEYRTFVQKYRYTHDVYNQIATNRGKENGTASSQRLRRVLFLDFDFKDYPDLHDAHDFTAMIKAKIPKLYLHACTNSGHGFHFYISVKANVGDFKDLIALNKELVSFLGADAKAASTTQIDRPPCTYNHKLEDGTYDYENREKWSFVKVVNNTYMVGKQFKSFDLPYISKQLKYHKEQLETQQILDKVDWNYESLNEYPCYLCIRKMLNEGADKGQRNFWHGRIVKMLQIEGYQESRIYSMCQEYNQKCRPQKSKEEIEADTERFLKEDYKLLGCYESIADPTKRGYVEAQCDKVFCGTYHNGAKISIEEGNAVKLDKCILGNRYLQTMTGNEYLIITLLDVYSDTFGRRGFRVKNLKDLLYSSIRQKSCINDRLLKKLLLHLNEKGWIAITPDKKKTTFDESKIKLNKRLKEFKNGYIEFYFSIANALIDGKIDQIHYLVFITLLRNLADGKKVTYEQLAEDLGMDSENGKYNIGKYIRKLAKERCLIVKKDFNEKGREFNRYQITSPDFFKEKSNDKSIPYEDELNIENNNNVEMNLTFELLA